MTPQPPQPNEGRIKQLENKVVTTIQTLELMWIEAKNELVKNKIMDRMLQRLNILKPSSQTTTAMAQNQSRIKTVEETIKQLEDMHSYEFAEEQKKRHNVGVIKPTKNAISI